MKKDEMIEAIDNALGAFNMWLDTRSPVDAANVVYYELQLLDMDRKRFHRTIRSFWVEVVRGAVTQYMDDDDDGWGSGRKQEARRFVESDLAVSVAQRSKAARREIEVLQHRLDISNFIAEHRETLL